jgi:hypothetical protein
LRPTVPPNRPGAQGPLQAGEASPVALPKRPWGQLMQEAEPEGAYVPTAHSCVVGDVEFAGHAYPAEQLPEQAGVDSAVVLPKVPPGHTKQVARPGVLYVPGRHGNTVLEVDPTGHAYPAVHLSHRVAPGVLENLPPGQSAQAEEAAVALYCPGRHTVQTLALAEDVYLTGVAFATHGHHTRRYARIAEGGGVKSMGAQVSTSTRSAQRTQTHNTHITLRTPKKRILDHNTYPGSHDVQLVSPAVPEYFPATQTVHTPRPVLPPTVPGGHRVQPDDPNRLYVPTGHTPLHATVVSPVVLPKLPAGQGVHADCPAPEYCPTPHAPLQAEELSAGTLP